MPPPFCLPPHLPKTRPGAQAARPPEVPALTIVCAYATEAATGQVLPLFADQALHALAAACAERIVQWLSDPQAGFYAPDGSWKRLRPADIAVLVRQRTEAAAVRTQLHQRGMASVYLSERDSVFASTQAQDLLYWLRAAATPLDVQAVRAALATRLMGLPLSTLADLAGDEQAFEPYLLHMQQLHSIWQRQGVLAMLRQTLYRFNLPSRWLHGGQRDGERCLTNYLHLAELLQTAASQLDGMQALIRWLAAQMATPDGGDADAQITRLESDADLVQIVTIHKSKGLEYPLVCLPFAASYRPLDPKNTPALHLPPDMPGGARPLVFDYSDEQLAQAERERLREDLRLLYVALTRARHALWLGLPLIKRGQKANCINEKTAAGYLIGGSQPRSAQQWLDTVAQFCAAHPAMALQTLDAGPDAPLVPCTAWQPRSSDPPLREAPAYCADFDKHWGISSYSTLVRALAAPPLPVSAAMLARAAENDEGDASATGDASALPAGLAPAPPAAAVWHRFRRGPIVGNLIHEQLQWLAQEDFALPPDGQGALAERLLRRCELAGRSTQEAQDLLHWLCAAIHHHLPPLHAALADIGAQHIGEMEFWLPVHQLAAQRVDALCRRHILPGHARPPLPRRELHGMLMGFADLVFCHAGRYWVLDYKTNHLGPDASAYGADALAQAMLKHRYDVQATLYLLALHRLLRARLGAAYRPEAQLGGALYYFLRGIDGAACGVHTCTPDVQLLDSLAGHP